MSFTCVSTSEMAKVFPHNCVMRLPTSEIKLTKGSTAGPCCAAGVEVELVEVEFPD